MVLLLDQDLTLHVRWEGARLHQHHPLTPRAARRLMQEVVGNMSKYRRELQIFSRFIEQRAEQPFGGLRVLDPAQRENQLPPAFKDEEQESRPAEVAAQVDISRSELGGESPMPEVGEVHE